MQEEEVWMDLPGYEDKYEFSSRGRIHVWITRTRLRHPWKDENGDLVIDLHRDGVETIAKVEDLMRQTHWKQQTPPGGGGLLKS